jgi:hypothetical protein
VIEPVNYVLQKTSRSKPFVVHADKVKKCHGETLKSWIAMPDVAVGDEMQSQAGERPPNIATTPPLFQENNLVPTDLQDSRRAPRMKNVESDVQRRAGTRPPGAVTETTSTRKLIGARDESVAVEALIAEDVTGLAETADADSDDNVHTIVTTSRSRRSNRKPPVALNDYVC